MDGLLKVVSIFFYCLNAKFVVSKAWGRTAWSVVWGRSQVCLLFVELLEVICSGENGSTLCYPNLIPKLGLNQYMSK